MNPTPPRLTIAIPTLNRSYCVTKCIESALAQPRDDIEIIVSDNGSTDDTKDVIARYSDPRLRVLRRESTIPAPAHGNFLVSQSKGAFFLGLSDDDFLEPDFADRVLDLLDRHPEASFVYTGCYIHYADAVVPSLVGPEIEDGYDFLSACLAGHREVCWCSCVTPTEFLRNNPLPDGILFGDMYYWTRLALSGVVGCVTKHCSHYTAYAAEHRNFVTSITVLHWADQTYECIYGVRLALESRSHSASDSRYIRREAARYVARSTANQFLWNALRGHSRLSLLRSLPPSIRYLHGDIRIWPRVIGGILAPRWLIEQRILSEARRRARIRSQVAATA